MAADLRHVQSGHRGPGPEAGEAGEGGDRLRHYSRAGQEEMDVPHGPEERRRQGRAGAGQEGTLPSASAQGVQQEIPWHSLCLACLSTTYYLHACSLQFGQKRGPALTIVLPATHCSRT